MIYSIIDIMTNRVIEEYDTREDAEEALRRFRESNEPLHSEFYNEVYLPENFIIEETNNDFDKYIFLENFGGVI